MKVNEGYYKEKANKKDFYLRYDNIAQLLDAHNIVQLLDALDNGDKTYFDNVQLEHVLSEFVRWEELDGTVVTLGTILPTPV